MKVDTQNEFYERTDPLKCSSFAVRQKDTWQRALMYYYIKGLRGELNCSWWDVLIKLFESSFNLIPTHKTPDRQIDYHSIRNNFRTITQNNLQEWSCFSSDRGGWNRKCPRDYSEMLIWGKWKRIFSALCIHFPVGFTTFPVHDT